MRYLYILGTIIFTVYGQIVLKWRISKYGSLPDILKDKLFFILKLLLDPYIISGFLSAFIASLFWMMAMTKFELSVAYPFMSLSFLLVFLISIFLFGETFNFHKIFGVVFIIIGLILINFK